ncbi:hypothetical protein AB0C81_23040 [Streptomyces roseoverticillatus]|uniref:hypothetical protein n=1 Tax=Streptomyces roseoverticillatus TaxID=66429 RepID=UPI0033DA31D2
MLRADPHERPRLEEIRVNLIARIAEAHGEGRLGEVDGLSVSLAASEDKFAQLDTEVARRSTVVQLGPPTFSQIATRSTKPSFTEPWHEGLPSETEGLKVSPKFSQIASH